MKYIVCESPGNFKIKEKAPPQRKKGEILLKINKVGICGTDLHAYQGNQAFFSYPRILGHELAAEVLDFDEDNLRFKKGDKVIVMPYLSCGHCISCRDDKSNCCAKIQVLGVHIDGGMQEIISVPAEILLEAGKLSDEEIAIVEPLAIGAHAIRRAEIKKDEYIFVIGCGPIGIGIMKIGQIMGARVIAMDVNIDRLQYVSERIGVEHVVNLKIDPLETIKTITNGDLVPVVFDATGNKLALESGITYMAHGGKYVLVGLSKGDLTFNHPIIHSKEASILCSRNASPQDFLTAKSVLESGRFPTSSYVTHYVKANEMIDYFDKWLDPSSGVIKAMVDF